MSKGGKRGGTFYFRVHSKIFSHNFRSKVLNQSVAENFPVRSGWSVRDFQAGSGGSIEIFRARSGNFFPVKVCPEFFNQDPITNFPVGSDAFFPHARSSERHLRIHVSTKV